MTLHAKRLCRHYLDIVGSPVYLAEKGHLLRPVELHILQGNGMSCLSRFLVQNDWQKGRLTALFGDHMLMGY